MTRHDNIPETIGNTPLVRLNELAPANANRHAKVESFDPLGSIKHRMALRTMAAAECLNDPRPGQTVIESTSGTRAGPEF